MRLRVGIAEEIEQHRRGRMRGDAFEQSDRFNGLALIHQQLGQLLDRWFVFRISLEDTPQNLFGLVVFVLQAVKPRQPQRRFGIGRIEPVDLAILLDGLGHRFRLAVTRADVAETSHVDSTQEPPRLHAVRVALQDFLGFRYGIVNPLCLPIHLRQAFADNLRFRVQRIGFFVGFDRLGGVVRAAGRFVLLLVDMAHREVVIGIGARGVVCGRDRFRLDQLLLRRLRKGSRSEGACQ